MPEEIQKVNPQNKFISEKLILLVSIPVLIFGLMFVAGSFIFNDPESVNRTGDLLLGFVEIPLIVTLPLFLIKFAIDRIHWVKVSIKNSWIIFISIIFIILITISNFISGYNYLVRIDQKIKNQYASVDIAYQKRFDLIPNIAKAAKTYSEFEQGVVKDIADARKSYAGAKTTDDKVHAANQFDRGVISFIVFSENYPNLKSDKLFNEIVVSLNQNENNIAEAKKTYNDKVSSFNEYIVTFPNVIVARLGNFQEKEYVKADLGKEIYNSKTLLDNLKE